MNRSHISELPQLARLSMLLLSIVGILAAIGVFCATPAHADEFKSFDPRYTNSVCQHAVVDADCYHYVGTYTTHQGCINKIGQLLGVDPNSYEGKFFIPRVNYTCKAMPPVGRYELTVYSAPCKVGLPFSQCPKLRK